MLAERADHLLGVDTHRDTHTAAVVEVGTGVVGPHTTTSADSLGYRRLLAFAQKHAPGRRVWAIESTGSYGAGLTSHLLEEGG
jgi:transposase